MGLHGNHSLVDTTADVANDWKIVSYKEQIEQVVHKAIIGHTAMGETATLQDIADALTDESWVDIAIPDEIVEGATNGYVFVRVNEGYVYQVFYDWVRGKVRVEYLGKEEQRKATYY